MLEVGAELAVEVVDREVEEACEVDDVDKVVDDSAVELEEPLFVDTLLDPDSVVLLDIVSELDESVCDDCHELVSDAGTEVAGGELSHAVCGPNSCIR